MFSRKKKPRGNKLGFRPNEKRPLYQKIIFVALLAWVAKFLFTKTTRPDLTAVNEAIVVTTPNKVSNKSGSKITKKVTQVETKTLSTLIKNTNKNTGKLELETQFPGYLQLKKDYFDALNALKNRTDNSNTASKQQASEVMINQSDYYQRVKSYLEKENVSPGRNQQ